MDGDDIGYGGTRAGEVKRRWGLFDDMILVGLVPDHVTYVGVLHACSHSRGRGMVDEARSHFEKMTVYGIEVRAEHYGCARWMCWGEEGE